MAKPNRLKVLEARHGDLEGVIVAYANKAGQAEAGRVFGISQATVSTYLTDKGYTPKIVYVKAGQEIRIVKEGEHSG